MPEIEPSPPSKALRQRLLDELCPWWAERLVNPRGGFFEGVDASGNAVDHSSQSLMVQARLTYVFSHAHVLGGGPSMLAAAQHGFKHLQSWSPIPNDGWAKRRSIDGIELDPTRDAYDQTFVILACAWYFRATNDAAALRLAEAGHGFFEDQLVDAQGGGFFEEHPNIDAVPRRQNPHMHLLEAVLAMHFATDDSRWLNTARTIVDLFVQRLYDSHTGSLGEYFNADWSPCSGALGALREPGHQFEWVWLLGEYMRATGDRQWQPISDRLFEFGVRFGRNANGAMPEMFIDGVDSCGRAVTPTMSVWPQTEYTKACVARADAGIPGMRSEAWFHLQLLLDNFFYANGANWCNQRSADGACIAPVTPARVLYHVVLAMAEIARLVDHDEGATS